MYLRKNCSSVSRSAPSYRLSVVEVEEVRGGGTMLRGGGTGLLLTRVEEELLERSDSLRRRIGALGTTTDKAESDMLFLTLACCARRGDGVHEVMDIKLCSIPQPLIGTK